MSEVLKGSVFLRDVQVLPSSTSTDDSRSKEETRHERTVCFTWNGLFRVGLALLLLGLISGLIVYLMGIGNIHGTSLVPPIPDFELFKQEDPFADLNGTYAWSNDGMGLELTVINALDPSWDEVFYSAIEDWDSGAPDALTITTLARQPEYDCEPENGYLKVCNGDYGNTNWKGLNKAYLDATGRIYASTAQMNEYFLSGTLNEADRRYTMCHELGHGFGLPHTDEKYYNLNQGNCMDYTTRPQRNMRPDERNFNTLASLYGVVRDNATVNRTDTTFGTNTGSAESSATNNAKAKNEKETDDRRLLRQLPVKVLDEQDAIPSWILDTTQEIDSLIYKGISISTHPRSRLLHRNEYSEAHEFDVGGHFIQVHLLLS